MSKFLDYHSPAIRFAASITKSNRVREDGAAAERAAITTWLRLETRTCKDKRDASLLEAYASLIEHGEHTRGAIPPD